MAYPCFRIEFDRDYAKKGEMQVATQQLRRQPALLLPVSRLILVSLMLCGGVACADDHLRLSGFGTLGYAIDNRNDVAPTRDISQLPKNGYATGSTWKLDTRVGVQLEYKPAETIDLVAQVVARDHFKSDLNSSTELAYIGFRPSTSVKLRVGRLGYDAFLMSDHRNVGYVYPWVRPPLEFYGWIPIFSVNGADATYTLNSNDTSWRLKAQAGGSKFWIPVNSGIGGGYGFKADKLLSLSLAREAGNLRLKAATSGFTAGSEVPIFGPLHSGLDQVAAADIPGVSNEAADLRRNLSFQGARLRHTSLGAVYDDNTWLLQAEIGHSSSTANVVPTSRMAYLGLARRIGNWTPFAMASRSRPGNPSQANNDWGATLNASLRDPAVRTLNAMRIDQTTVTIGLRWDFQPKAAFKLQLDHSHSHPPGYGIGNRSVEAAQGVLDFKLLSATLDFVF